MTRWHKGTAKCECGEETALEYSSCGDFLIVDTWDRTPEGMYLCNKCSLAVRGIEGRLVGSKRPTRKHRQVSVEKKTEIVASGLFYHRMYDSKSYSNVTISKNRFGTYEVGSNSAAYNKFITKENMRKYIHILQRALTEL